MRKLISDVEEERRFKATIINMSENGKTLQEIADFTGYPYSLVCKYKRIVNPAYKPRKRLTEEQKKLIEQIGKERLSSRLISLKMKELGHDVSDSQIYKYMVKIGMPAMGNVVEGMEYSEKLRQEALHDKYCEDTIIERAKEEPKEKPYYYQGKMWTEVNVF